MSLSKSHTLPEHALFVYGSLQPGGSAHEILSELRFTAIEATIRARHSTDGWGKTGGYPAIILDEHGPEVAGYLILANDLERLIPTLDEYEGHAYQRVRYHAITSDGSVLACQVYELASDLHPMEEEPVHLDD